MGNVHLVQAFDCIRTCMPCSWLPDRAADMRIAGTTAEPPPGLQLQEFVEHDTAVQAKAAAAECDHKGEVLYPVRVHAMHLICNIDWTSCNKSLPYITVHSKGGHALP